MAQTVQLISSSACLHITPCWRYVRGNGSYSEAIQKLEELKWWGQVQGFELELGATPSILRQTKEWINLEWPSREQLGDICGWKIRQELSVCVCSSESKFHPELRQRKASKSREVISLLFSAVIASTWTIASRPWKTWIFSDRSRGGPWK